MYTRVVSVQDIGSLVRATRKGARIRLDDLAGTVKMSKQFVSDLELGKPGVQLGKVLQVLQEMGLYLYVDVPDSTAQQLERSKELIAKTTARRSSRKSA